LKDTKSGILDQSLLSASLCM